MAMFSQAAWDERYGSSDRIWSGNPNPRLVAAAAELTPGAALDVGCGEGADAIWLASQGWHVTGIDISAVALDRAASQAAIAGRQIADRTSWQRADVLSWTPPARQFDLVSAQFMQLPRAELEALHRRLAEAVRPGGVLLIVGHHPSDLESAGIHPPASSRAAVYCGAGRGNTRSGPVDHHGCRGCRNGRWRTQTASPLPSGTPSCRQPACGEAGRAELAPLPVARPWSCPVTPHVSVAARQCCRAALIPAERCSGRHSDEPPRSAPTRALSHHCVA